MKPIHNTGQSSPRGAWTAAFLRFVAGAVLLFGGSMAALFTPVAVPEAYAGSPSASEASGLSPSVVPVPIGLSGTITTPVFVDTLVPGGQDQVFVGTSWGLYIIAGGNIQRFIYTPAPIAGVVLMNDFTEDGTKEIAICLASSYYPSVRCYDGATGAELWESVTTQGAIVGDVGWAQVQSLPVDMEVVDDVNSNGSQDIAVCCSGCLYMLEGSTGKVIWDLEARHLSDGGGGSLTIVRNAGDVNEDGVADLAVAGEAGLLAVVSGKSGRLLFERRLGNIAELRCLEVDSRKKALVALKDKVLLFDLSDGKSQWESSVDSSVGEYETGLWAVGDTSGDGVPEVLMFQNKEAESQVILLNGATGDVQWRTPTPVEGNTHPRIAVMNGRGSLLVPQGRSDSVERIAVVDVGKGEIRQALEVACPAEASSSPGAWPERWVTGFGGDSFILVSNSSDLICVSSDASVAWYCPRVSDSTMEEGCLNGDTVPDLLLCSSRVLAVIDGATHAELWRYQVAYGDLLASGGISQAKIANQGVVFCRGTEVNLVSGKDGQVLMSHQADGPILSLDLMTIGQDGLAFGIGTTTGILILNPRGEPVWTKPYAEWDESENTSAVGFLALDDVNSDGISDLAVSLGSRLVVATSTKQSGQLDFTPGQPIDGGTGTTIQRLSQAPDMDRDGIRELCFFKNNGESGSSVYVVSPASGETLMELNREGGLAVNLACADFDGDGWPDSIAYSKIHTKSAGGSAVGGLAKRPLLEIISGQSTKVLWQHSYDSQITDPFGLFGSTDSMPASPVSDMSGDGLPDLAFTQVDSSQGYVETVAVYDVKRNQLLKEIVLNEPARDGDDSLSNIYDSFPRSDGTFPGGNILLAPNGASGEKNILVILDPEAERTDYVRRFVTHPVVVDLAGEVVLRFLLPCSLSVETGSPDSIAVLRSDGGLCFLRLDSQSPIVSPAEDSSLLSPIRVRLDQDAGRGLTKVYINHVSCGSTYGQQISVPAGPGAHRLTVYTLDQWGRLRQQTVNIEIRGRIWVPILTFLVLLLLIAGICVPRFLQAWEKRALRLKRG
jgi:outer membrane protein assembly factor BamB